ncbi:YusW family protein [Paenibacillus glycanilyticus]|uniref:YusW family protein n=1 Tax=Paenibacillus glycanilyticus TaxID=126569 RepID=UPI0013E37276|nr:YusW family protein [Paenibacillus glycanilyticus]
MKKKISYILIGALSTIMLSYGVVAYADYDSSAIKEDNRAASDSYVVPSKTAEAEVKFASAQPTASEAPIQLDQLKALELKIDGNNVKVKIELEKEEAKTESKVEIKIGEDQKKYLTGNEATQFIEQLLAALKLQANMDKQQVMDALFTHFAVEPAKVDMNIDMKWKDRSEELKFKDEKDDADDEADKDETEAQTVKSTVQHNQKAQLAAKEQSVKQEQKKALIAQKKALQQAWQKAHKEQQEKKKQQKQLNRSDRDHDQNKGQKDDEDDDDQGEDHGHDGNHGKHQEHEEHDHED